MSSTTIQLGVTLPAAGGILQPSGVASASASLFGDLMAAAFAGPGQQGQEPAPEETAVPAEAVTETPEAHLPAPATWQSVFTASTLPSVPDLMAAPAADLEESPEGPALTGTTASDAAPEPVVSTPEVPQANPTEALQPVSPNEPTGMNIPDQPQAVPAPDVNGKPAGQAAPTEAPPLAEATGPATPMAASPAPVEPTEAGDGSAQLDPTAPNVAEATAPGYPRATVHAGPSPAAVQASGIRPETKTSLLAPAPAAAHVEHARAVSAPLDVPVVQQVIQTADPVAAQSPVQQGSFAEALKTASAPAPAAPAPAPLQTQLAKPLFTLAATAPGEHVMTVKVAPEDLGPVTVRAHIGSDGVRLELFAAGDAGRDAVRAALPDLRRELAQQCLGASLDLSGRNAPSDQGNQQNQSGAGNPEGLHRPRLRMVNDADLAPHGQTLRSLRSDAALDVVA